MTERAQRLRAAYESSAADAHQQLLLGELMEHFRRWCVRCGFRDPFGEETRRG